MGKQWKQWLTFIFLGSKITAGGDCSHEIKRHLLLGRKIMTNLDSTLNRDITLPTKVCLVKAMVFPVVMYGCESWTIKKAECQIIDAFELWCWRRLLSPLDCKEVQPVHPKVGQSWVFIGRTYAEAPIHWPPDVKNWLIWKSPDAGKDWRREEKGTTEDEMVGGHHWLNGHEFEQAPEAGDGQGSLACCSPWGYKESDTTERLNWTELNSLLNALNSLLNALWRVFSKEREKEKKTKLQTLFHSPSHPASLLPPRPIHEFLLNTRALSLVSSWPAPLPLSLLDPLSQDFSSWPLLLDLSSKVHLQRDLPCNPANHHNFLYSFPHGIHCYLKPSYWYMC